MCRKRDRTCARLALGTEHDVVVVHRDARLRVHGVREAGELGHALEPRREVLLDARARRLRQAAVVVLLLEGDRVELGAYAQGLGVSG